MILLDLNVLLDVVQKHEPHYAASAGVIERVIHGEVTAALPAHAMTTVQALTPEEYLLSVEDTPR